MTDAAIQTMPAFFECPEKGCPFRQGCPFHPFHYVCEERGCPFRYGCPEHPLEPLSEAFFIAKRLMVSRFTAGLDTNCALDVPRRVRAARQRLRAVEAKRWACKRRAVARIVGRAPDALDYLLRPLLADVFAGVAK